jgi:hypothetical protein
VRAFDLGAIDAGIRPLVAFLRAAGFETTDSGDGSKADMACALPFPNVFAVVPPAALVAEADRMAELLREAGALLEPGDLQATYDPIDGIGVLGLTDERGRWALAFEPGSKAGAS